MRPFQGASETTEKGYKWSGIRFCTEYRRPKRKENASRRFGEYRKIANQH